MDCTLSGNATVKKFSYAIACLCRIGKDLYLDFNEIDGLYLKTLNDAKSAFCCFHFQPSFFERCSSPMILPNNNNNSTSSTNRKRRQPDDNNLNSSSLTCRVPLKILNLALRSRKNVKSLRIRSYGTHDNDDESAKMHLSFEYVLESQQHNASMMRVLHRIGVAECDSILAVVSTTIRDQQDSYSEIVSSPALFTKMLDPLRKTAEILFTVNDVKRHIAVATFHNNSVIGGGGGGDVAAELLLPMVLKTETCMRCDEFEGYTWRNNNPTTLTTSCLTSSSEPPENLNEEVNLVFAIREVKTLLQFCSSMQDPDMKIVMSFQYGGKPIVLESAGKAFTVQLIMATLDHKLLRRRR